MDFGYVNEIAIVNKLSRRIVDKDIGYGIKYLVSLGETSKKIMYTSLPTHYFYLAKNLTMDQISRNSFLHDNKSQRRKNETTATLDIIFYFLFTLIVNQFIVLYILRV